MNQNDIDELIRMILSLCDELQSEIEYRYQGTEKTYPSEKRRYDRDMSTVIEARRLARSVG